MYACIFRKSILVAIERTLIDRIAGISLGDKQNKGRQSLKSGGGVILGLSGKMTAGCEGKMSAEAT